jgi:hypothetical protein
MGFRTNLINKKAAEHLQPGEEIAELAIVRAGSGGRSYAVAATPRNVYVFALGGLGFGKVSEVVARLPIKRAAVELGSSFLTVGSRGAEKPEHVFSALPGRSPKRLAAYVAERNR